MQLSPEAVLFDMDGLLLDSETLSLQCFNDEITARGLDEQNAVFMSLIGTNERAQRDILSKSLGHLLDIEAFWKDWKQRYQSTVENHPVPLKKGARELLEWLKQNGIARSVATSSNTEHATHLLKNAEIMSYFDVIVGGDQVTRSKPEPDIYLKAAEETGVQVSNAIALEDSANGVRAAVAAGLHVVQVPDLVQPTEELLGLGHRVCRDLGEVLELIQFCVSRK